MSSKINFDWSLFSDVDLQMSATEKIVIQEHFNIWLQGNSGNDECSKPELQEKFDIFRAGWIMSQMFTG
jgi:hypothetical protein